MMMVMMLMMVMVMTMLPSERKSLSMLFQLYHLFNVDAAIVVCVS